MIASTSASFKWTRTGRPVLFAWICASCTVFTSGQDSISSLLLSQPLMTGTQSGCWFISVLAKMGTVMSCRSFMAL